MAYWCFYGLLLPDSCKHFTSPRHCNNYWKALSEEPHVVGIKMSSAVSHDRESVQGYTIAASWFSEEEEEIRFFCVPVLEEEEKDPLVSWEGHSASHKLNQTFSSLSSLSPLFFPKEHLAVFLFPFLPPGIVSPNTGASPCRRCQELSIHTTDGVIFSWSVCRTSCFSFVWSAMSQWCVNFIMSWRQFSSLVTISILLLALSFGSGLSSKTMCLLLLSEWLLLFCRNSRRIAFSALYVLAIRSCATKRSCLLRLLATMSLSSLCEIRITSLLEEFSRANFVCGKRDSDLTTLWEATLPVFFLLPNKTYSSIACSRASMGFCFDNLPSGPLAYLTMSVDRMNSLQLTASSPAVNGYWYQFVEPCAS